MAKLFLTLLNMSITAGWIVVAVVILRLFLKKSPKWISCLLWGLVGLRLALPFSIESILSILPSAKTLPDDILNANSFRIDSGVSFVDSSVNEYLGSHYYEGVTVPAYHGFNLMTSLSILWLAGIVWMLIYALLSYLKIKKRTSESVKHSKGIYLCDKIDTPFILGLISPKIYLPYDISESDKEYVIAHEQAHLKRLDHIWKPLGFALLTVHWFNPLVWVGYILLCRDIELACDEKVIKDMGVQYKKPYSEALINCSVPRRMIAACPLAFGEVGVKGRIKSVLSYKKPAFWIIILSVIAVVAASVCLITNPKSNPKPNKPSNSDTQSSVSSDIDSSSYLENYLNSMKDKTDIYFYSAPLQTSEIYDAVINKVYYADENDITNLLKLLKEQNWQKIQLKDLEYAFDGHISYNQHIYFNLTYKILRYNDYICTANDNAINILKKYSKETVDCHYAVVNGSTGYYTNNGDYYETQVSYANSSYNREIYKHALNSSKFNSNPTSDKIFPGLPIYRIDSLTELKEFKDKFKDDLTFDSGYDEVPSFNSVTANYDDKFFKENALFLVYVEATSGSYRYNVHNIYNDGKEFKIAIHKVRNPEEHTEDMAGWFVTVGISKNAVKNCTDYNAYICK